ncbi:Clp protease ClpB [Arthrospiribacter ruber]|uniref:Clp protease ClpB n=1 Tax=Arthrospiribacter ruber TaxID=2487934 RepID=A0A951MGM3_9BACT|nr:Clp protease ClpB [Arthrospiribacter ruber]MBW3469101.1 Clp protease ClpB [Arthrospiribacter ruber]
MKARLILLLLLTLPVFGFAQAKLERLLEDREKMHREWRASESKKSGIFGNRTKKDMIETNEWMERIIQKDNQIMDELKMLSEIEKTEITYEKNDYKFISQKQEREIGLLKRALQEKDQDIQEKVSGKRTYEWTTFLFFLSTVALGYLFWKKRA